MTVGGMGFIPERLLMMMMMMIIYGTVYIYRYIGILNTSKANNQMPYHTVYTL